ncbi:hypothetical protein MASR2M69_22820 [Bacteroidota bacterium]
MPFNGVIDVKDDKSDNAGNVANMSRITGKLNLPNKKNKRNECGYFHVWFRVVTDIRFFTMIPILSGF